MVSGPVINLEKHTFWNVCCVVRTKMGNQTIIYITSRLSKLTPQSPGKEQLLITAYAKALEVIPRQLCDNAGFDATTILNKLRQKHAQGIV